MCTLSLTGLYVGSTESLSVIFTQLKDLNYTVVGYKVVDNVLRLCELGSYEEIPTGVEDVQSPGNYTLTVGGFYRHGPDSPKKFLYPPRLTLFKVTPNWEVVEEGLNDVRLAFFGLKPCDLASIKVLDRVLGGVDEFYTRVRANMAVIVENCTIPGNTCFCATMGTGPRARNSFDIAYTKINNKLVIEAGSELGLKLLNKLEVEPIDDSTYADFEATMRRASLKARANFEVDNLPELIELNIGCKVYIDMSKRCLGCANCNMVCPTCFCFDILDIPKIDGSAERVRVWDGCLNYTYAQVAGGHFRPDLCARYRHFILHKFTYWIKQFGTYGCVGCGRCITWCPTGIDLRETIVQVLKGVTA
ncbi:MAG: 4Fe-4S dicluster domain-containing protein [Sulfolobales archaeon]